mgnify:CR=1 FL=1
MKTKLIGSSNSIDQLRQLISKRYFYSDVSFVQIDEKTWIVQHTNGSKPLTGFRVIKTKSRYRFEGIL